MCCARIRLRSRHVATFWVSDRLRSFLDLAVDRVPARSYRRSPCTTSLMRGSRRARSPSPKDITPCWGTPMRFAQGSGRAWVRPGGDPGPFDRCLLLTDVVFKDDRPTSRRTSHRHVPTRCESLRFHAACPLRRTVGPRSGCCLPRPPFRRRTSDAPSQAGVPGGAMSTGVGPRSLARSQVETRKPRPTRPSRVNGFLGLALARSIFSLRSFFRPDRRPDPAAPAVTFFSGRDLTRVERELLPCHRPTRHNACPQSS
jgi:hypothetical protein